ncbi:MAG: BrnT family toxin [Alphaproteobacteria bacterium]
MSISSTLCPLFDGDVKERIDRRFDYGETRIRCLGEIEGRVCVVIYTWRGDNRRITSARKANVRERREYRAGNARRSS